MSPTYWVDLGLGDCKLNPRKAGRTSRHLIRGDNTKLSVGRLRGLMCLNLAISSRTFGLDLRRQTC